MRPVLTRASLSLSTIAVTVAALLAGVAWTVVAAPPAAAATAAAAPASGFDLGKGNGTVSTDQPTGYPNGVAPGVQGGWRGVYRAPNYITNESGDATCGDGSTGTVYVDLTDPDNINIAPMHVYCPSGAPISAWHATFAVFNGGFNDTLVTFGWGAASGPTGALATGGSTGVANSATHCSCADPVDTQSGEYHETSTDISVAGRGSIGWTRTYGSIRATTDGPLGYGWTASWLTRLTFDGSGQPTWIQENGAQVPFTASGSTYVPPTWANAAIVHNSDGTWTLTRHKTTKFTFDATGALTAEADLNGNTATLTYSGGVLSAVTAASGRALAVTWDTAKRHIIKVTDPMGQYVQYTYNATTGNLATFKDPTLNTWTYGYTTTHLIKTVTTPRGGVTTNVWDTQNRVKSQTDQVNKTTTFTYTTNPGGDPQTRVTDPSGVVTALTYSGGVLIQKIVNPANANPHVTTYKYDPASLALTATVDGNGVGWAGTADANGNLVSRTDGNGNNTTIKYNNLDQPLTVTDAASTKTQLTYDTRGNLLTATQPLTGGNTPTSALVTYHHDDPAHPGDLTSITDPRGKTTTIAYASTTGDLASVTDPTGAKATFAYNGDGWRTSTTTPEGNKPGANAAAFTTTTGYDAGGNPTSSTDGLGNTARAAYDADYNKVKVTTPDQHDTVIDFDLADRPTVVHQPNTATTSTTYDPAGRVATQVDGNTNTTTYLYDGFGDLASSTTPNNKTTTYTHDKGGLLATVVDPDQRTTTQTWDPAGHLAAVDYTDPATPDVTYTYDTLGRRATMTTGTGSTADAATYTYDLASRMTSTTDTSGTVGYTWDAASNLTGLRYPDGKSVTRSYDDANRWTGLVDPAGKQFSFGYNANTDLTSLAYPNTVTDTRTFDSTDRLTGIVDTTSAATAVNPTLLTLGYDFDASSQQVAEHVRQIGNYDAITGYDGNDRLGAFTTQLGPTTSTGGFGYDNASNLTAMPLAVSQTFNTADQITGRADSTGSSVFGYDNEGERTSQTLTPAAVTRTPVTVPGTVSAANGWQLNDSATASGGTVTLTPATANLRGSAFWGTALPSNDLHATFTATNSGGTGGDGMTFALIDSAKDSPTSLGVGGGALGFDGLDGTAVALDTYENQTIEPSNNFAAIRTSTSNPANPPAADVGYRMNAVKVPNLRSGTHQVKVDTSPNHMTVAIDGVQVVSTQVNLPPNVYVGFTAATGGATDTHAASNITITSGTSTTPAATTVGYGYDQAGRLATYTPANGTVTTYRYNGDGLRLSKATGSGGAQPFAWDRSGSLPTILTDGAWDYVYGPQGQPLEQIKASTGQVDYLHVDAHNSVRLITDGTGADIGTATYNPYGAPFATANTETSALGYHGQYTDAESGLLYLRARMYDPNAGQFLTRDPLAAASGDPYGYAGKDPVNGGDPTGLLCLTGSCVLSGYLAVGDTINGAADQVGCFVHEHKTGIKTGVGLTLGVVAAATGFGALADIAILGMTTSQLSVVGLVAGGVSVGIDLPACLHGEDGHSHDAAACGAVALGGAGVIAAVPSIPVLANILPITRVTADIIGWFGWSLGNAALAIDSGVTIGSFTHHSSSEQEGVGG